jgi:alpha-L-rhamnosidase
VRGTVACGWSLAGGRITVTVAVPPGSTAVLELPTRDPESVTEDGEPAGDRPGVLALDPSDAGATLRLTSGRYSFDATAPGDVENAPSPSQLTTPSLRETP